MIAVRFKESRTTKNYATVKEMVQSISAGRRGEDISVEIKISPEIAVDIMEYQKIHSAKTNFTNRTITPSTVTKYVKGIKAKEWTYNPMASIGFDDKLNFIQGQHRLLAIIRSGESASFSVVFNCPEKAFVHLDNGKPRNLADILTTMGYPKAQSVVLAGTLKLLAKYNSGQMTKFDNARSSNTECLALLESNPQLPESIRDWYHNKDLKTLLGANVLCFFHYIASQIDRTKVNDFLSKLSSGANISENSPILTLRKKLQSKGRRDSSGGRPRGELKLAWMTIAFNYWMENRLLREITYDPDSSSFPEFNGLTEKA